MVHQGRWNKRLGNVMGIDECQQLFTVFGHRSGGNKQGGSRYQDRENLEDSGIKDVIGEKQRFGLRTQ
ncbi:hypothetical protein Xenpb_02589 [Xenorhabdus sp. PB62.4]|nr:hypothetical protein [Xenorhabdus sp. PB62.4]